MASTSVRVAAKAAGGLAMAGLAAVMLRRTLTPQLSEEVSPAWTDPPGGGGRPRPKPELACEVIGDDASVQWTDPPGGD